jgi:hypothetical protein
MKYCTLDESKRIKWVGAHSIHGGRNCCSNLKAVGELGYQPFRVREALKWPLNW